MYVLTPWQLDKDWAAILSNMLHIYISSTDMTYVYTSRQLDKEWGAIPTNILNIYFTILIQTEFELK